MVTLAAFGSLVVLFGVNLFEHFELLRRQVSLKVPQKIVEIKVVLCPRPKSDCSDVVIHRKVNEVNLHKLNNNYLLR